MFTCQVVPEIEFPGHAVAVLSVFPSLCCTGRPIEKPSAKWGVFHDVFCIGGDDWTRFLEAVVEEVTELFPSSWIHMGGDEVPLDRWTACPRCNVSTCVLAMFNDVSTNQNISIIFCICSIAGSS